MIQSLYSITSSIIDRLPLIFQYDWIASGSSSDLSGNPLLMENFNICKFSSSSVAFRTWSQETVRTLFRDFWIEEKISMSILSCKCQVGHNGCLVTTPVVVGLALKLEDYRMWHQMLVFCKQVHALFWISKEVSAVLNRIFLYWLSYQESNHQIS